MSSIDALEWLFLIIAPTEWDCPSVFLKTLLRSASCFPWGGFNMDSFFMGLHHDLRCILLSLLFSCALSLFKCRSYLWVYSGSRFLLCLFLLILIIAGGVLIPVIAWCDAGNPSPPLKSTRAASSSSSTRDAANPGTCPHHYPAIAPASTYR